MSIVSINSFGFILFLISLFNYILSTLMYEVSLSSEEREKCHRGYRNVHGKLCHGYINNPRTLDELVKKGIYVPAFKSNSSVNLAQIEKIEKETIYPTISDKCLTLTWFEMNERENQDKENLKENNHIINVDSEIGPWGNCVNITMDNKYRYITSNSIPDYYFNPYCPFGLKGS